ncbi:cation diffusion facilitator family transporter [Modicisalibacter xianhensis]|uniref:Cation diffusion facilitator family transporter n=1 Tax=Modicisalibacter xianhensis TaxID=442341 RepID=A0A1I3FWU3_9GAMM|nr:cation diffusion facilitator family transporter [Halomonas xianhensis]TDX32216.1 cation diffusion facilitator family transporter [Halomonas xianhensis]SFI15703.1 cation diffusion facilitator family transporter [Halomonas xianhensis]
MQSHLEQRALKISIAMTLFVAGLGVALGLLAGSQSILFDGMFSSIDAAMSGLALLVSRLAVREASERFQHGYWHFEPMVAAFNGAVLTLLCCYAFLNAIQGLLEGGRDLAFGAAIAYAVVVTGVCFGMYVFEKGINREADSEFLRIDTQSWLMAALITSALLVAFVIAALLEGTALAHWTPYVDSLLLAVLTVCFLPVPLGIVRRAMKEVFLIAPSHIDQEVHDAMQQVMQRDGLLDYHSHVAKTGRGHFIEIHIITRKDFASQRGMAELDEIREEIAANLSIPPQHRWFTVAFTADPRWA